MSFVANPFVVVLDANVLVPFRVRDVLLTFAQDGLFRARITDEILDEWTRNLFRLKPHLEANVRAQEAAMHEEEMQKRRGRKDNALVVNTVLPDYRRAREEFQASPDLRGHICEAQQKSASSNQA